MADNYGGGIYNSDLLTLTNSTLSQNSASLGGAGIRTGGTATLDNTIIANSLVTTDCTNSGSLTTRHNLIKDGTCIVAGTDGNLSGNPMLGTLTGSLADYPISMGSPAFNSGDNLLIPIGVTNDEGGTPRIYGGAVDMGAVEAIPACPTFPYTVAAGSTPDLIFAIDCANGIGGAQTINLPHSTYTLIAINNDIPYDNTGLPVINGNLTINGGGATITRSTAGSTPNFRLFAVASGVNLTLNNLTLSHGSSVSNWGRHLQRRHADRDQQHAAPQLGNRRQRHLQRRHADGEQQHLLRQLGKPRWRRHCQRH